MGPDYLAERVGFEPTKGYKPLLVFKTSAFDHSATSPCMPLTSVWRARIVLAAWQRINMECTKSTRIWTCQRQSATIQQSMVRQPDLCIDRGKK